MDIFKNNYLQSYGSGDSWRIELDSAKREVKSYYKETLEVAEFIYANKTGHMYLFYSGGVDSQYIFNIFLKLGFNFTVVIIRLNGNNGIIYNEHDIKHAVDSCNINNITPLIFDIDFDHFVISDKIIEIAEFCECSSYMLPATIYAFGEFDGFIISGNEPSLRYKSETHSWYLEEDESIHSIVKYFRKKKLSGSPFTLAYSPEMLLSFLLDPSIENLANNMYPGKLGSNSTKSHVYNNGSGFNLPVYDFVSLSRIKYTGYEIIKDSPIFNHPNMSKFREFRKKWGGQDFKEYHELVSRLRYKE